jgi:hypothetical protein
LITRKIIVVQDYGSTSYDTLDSLVNAAAQDIHSLQQTNTMPPRPLTPFAPLDSAGRVIQRNETDKQQHAIATSTSTHDEPIHDFQLFGPGPMVHLQNDPGYDAMRSPIPGTIHESHGFGSDAPSSKETVPPPFQNPWISSSAAHPTSPQPLLQCPDCKKILKTRTELK